ncbi:MAG TPA: hypothetical protein VK025_04375 [Steroidobacter sp.]|nr:hypothetical protein [Steroidobacter sp.]
MTVERMLPLYQGMMTTFYDHRAADVVKSESAAQRQNQPRYLSDEEKADPTRLAIPQYWVRESLLDPDLPEWLIGFSDITSPTNERTMVPVAIPRVGAGNKLPIVIAAESHAHCLLACLASFALDFQVRQKVGGTTLNYFLVKQFPVLPPSSFEEACAWAREHTLSAWIAPRVAELVATANDMTQVAEQLDIEGAPFRWNPERRALLRAELDAAFFHLYGLSRDDTAYVMDTFPIVKRKDEATHGEYRTRRLILEVYDALAEAMRTGTSYQTRLAPPERAPAEARLLGRDL